MNRSWQFLRACFGVSSNGKLSEWFLKQSSQNLVFVFKANFHRDNFLLLLLTAAPASLLLCTVVKTGFIANENLILGKHLYIGYFLRK